LRYFGVFPKATTKGFVFVRIDPVLLVSEELRQAQSLLQTAVAERRRGAARELSQRIRLLEEALSQTVARSAPGASELLHLAAARLDATRPRYAKKLCQIASRLSEGIRYHSDLVWLRAFAAAPVDVYGPWHKEIVALVESAISGAARPVLVYRAALPLKREKRTSARSR
jgi:hypothetical protein